MEKQKLERLSDEEFLQYMQFAWSCYEILIPAEVVAPNLLQGFSRRLTKMEVLLIGQNQSPSDDADPGTLRSLLIDDLLQLTTAVERLDTIAYHTLLNEFEKALDLFDGQIA